jgi:hypothetical protein
LLTGPGVVWELDFGDWILLQPERVNAYAQALMQTLARDPLERGSIEEQRVLDGDLVYSAMDRLNTNDERFVLFTLHQTLIERGLCVRTGTEQGNLLLFPSFYRRERPERTQHPDVLVSYTFNGFLDEIYATLVVRLHHTQPFSHEALWRYAADFRTMLGKQLGVKMNPRGNGLGELEVYFDQEIPVEERIIFSKYVHEHLREHARDVVRLRHYICPYCGTPVANREVAMTRLENGKDDIVCVSCEKRVPLWDELENLFASEETRRMVHELRRQSDYVLDNESKDRALVGEVMSTVALANHLSRELIPSDHGIDMEIEFKSDAGEATGRKLYLQLKSGDSYLRTRGHDGAEIFQIRNERHARYWRDQAFPVMLVLRSSSGEIRWMEIRDLLRRSQNPVKQFVFDGEPFAPESVRRWRDHTL